MTKNPLLAALLLLFAQSLAAATVEVKQSTRAGEAVVSVAATKAPLSAVVAKLNATVGGGVELEKGFDKPVTLALSEVPRDKAWKRLASATGLRLIEKEGRRLLMATEPTADLDVKDASLDAILASLQKQCGVRNVVVDPGVTGTGTFLFHDVPCTEAFEIVLRSLGLDGEFQGEAGIAVRK